MHINSSKVPAEDFEENRLASVTVAAVEAHYHDRLGNAYAAFPAISCDLNRLAALMPSFELMGLVSQDAHNMVWLVRIDEDHFAIASALPARVPAALRLVVAMADPVACVRPFRAEFLWFAATLEYLLSQVLPHEN